MTRARQTRGGAAGQGAEFLRAANLESAGVPHGFGLRGSAEPPGVRRAAQVHGARVLCADDPSGAALAQPPGIAPAQPPEETPRTMHRAETPREADALYATQPGVTIGVVTADCVPILLAALSPPAATPAAAVAAPAAATPAAAPTADASAASTAPDASAVAAIHAGWRGLAAGVIEAGVAALRSAAPRSAICAAIGPHIGPCCYEVDAPVLTALFDSPTGSPQPALPNALRPTRPGHYLLDLGAVAQHRLTRAGLPAAHITTLPHPCTRCAPHFASHRRDGPQSGRMLHWITVPGRGSPGS